MFGTSEVAVRVKTSGVALGADVEGVDLSKPLDFATVHAIKDAWFAHLVVRFRRQRLTDAQLAEFSHHLGVLDAAPPAEVDSPFVPQHPEVTVISNIIVDGKPIGSLGAGESVWHTDMSYAQQPPSASVLYSIEIPPSGGDTSFSNMYLAAERLPDNLRSRLEGRGIKHDATTTSAGDLRKGFDDVEDPRAGPGTVHPIFRTHPVTKKRALFIGRRKNAYIDGLELAESERLLDALFAHVDRSEFTWTQQWEIGDVLMWDNRCVMHRRDAFDPTSRRLMHRTQVKGETPV
jgi:taurine dioxygenase